MRAPNMRSLSNDIEREFPGVIIWGKGDLAHAQRVSDHNEDDTPGVRAAQSDSDTVPEHRAIDVALGPAFTRNQAYALIIYILNDPVLRARLLYINFENWQWSASNGWVRADNSNDPHPTHIHFSGRASKDADSSPWLLGEIMGSDYGSWGSPAVVGGRPDSVLLADVWGQELFEESPFAPGAQSGRTKRLVRLEQKLDAINTKLDTLLVGGIPTADLRALIREELDATGLARRE